MGLSSKCQNTFETSLFFNYYKKTLTPLLSQCNLPAGSLGWVEEKNFAGRAANESRQHFPPEIAKESLLAEYSQGGVRPKLDSLGVDDAHLLWIPIGQFYCLRFMIG